MKNYFLFSLLFVVSSILNHSVGQTNEKKPFLSFNKGLGIAPPDSSFSINFRFRMQNRALYTTESTKDFSASEIEARVRRLRLRMEGFMLNPKFTYLIQLSFSRGDMDWNVRDNSSVNNSPNVVRDAVIYYRPVKNLQLFFGQTKLPGNRQRVVSSGELQFIDRSIVNATFNIDRDFGTQAHYGNYIGKVYYMLKGAVTTGEGRNANLSRGGLAFTGRAEILPLGEFTNKGDYFEGDLEREQKVKISLAGGMSHNERAERTGGQIGLDLFQRRDITTYIFDGLFKYKGIAIYGEYINRNSNNPTTVRDRETRAIYTGSGTNVQGSYLFKNNIELAGRYSIVIPKREINNFHVKQDVFALNITKYLKGHRVKLQGYAAYNRFFANAIERSRNNWSIGFQTELGI